MRKMWNKRWMIGCIFGILVLVTGCAAIEPEKRAYPLTVGIDWKEGRYEVYLTMANLSKSTGQGKEGSEEQAGDQSGALILSGNSRKEMEESYQISRELYLDLGHVKAILFGEELLKDEQRMKQVLQEMEEITQLGTNAYVFATKNMEEVCAKNGNEVASLADFLCGIYENRKEEKEDPITLLDVYKTMEHVEKMPSLRWIVADQNGLFVEDYMVQAELAKKVLRFHVVANSDTKKDQAEKLMVRDAVLDSLKPITQNATSKEEMEQMVKQELATVKQVAEALVYPKKVTAAVQTDWFPTKTYGDCTFPEGVYDALRIEIGEGKGHNWWCVLYPSLCFMDLVKAVVPEEGKEALRKEITEDAYTWMLQPKQIKIKFRWFS